MAQVALKSRRYGFELTLTAEVTAIGNLPIEDAQRLFEMAFQPTIDKLCTFLAATIGSQDMSSIQILEETIRNMAKSKVENI